MSAPVWWVEAQGRAWGPYPPARLRIFRDEGRLSASTLVAQTREGPFTPAALAPQLSALFDEPEPAASSPATPTTRPLLVLAAVQDAEGFEAALGGHGEWTRIRPGVWLVRARESAAALRNALSRRVGSEALLVVEAPLEAAAWFNLDGATDRALRRLWGA